MSIMALFQIFEYYHFTFKKNSQEIFSTSKNKIGQIVNRKKAKYSDIL